MKVERGETVEAETEKQFCALCDPCGNRIRVHQRLSAVKKQTGDVFTKAKLAFATDSGEKKAMSFTGTVKGGVVVLPPGVKLPEGLEVRLTVPDSASFAERYAAYIGVADDLPSDLAENLDHYVHEHRKP